MRWDNLFDDLESQIERELSADELDLEVEEERLRLARLGIRERIAALHAAGSAVDPLVLILSNSDRIEARPVALGRDWVLAHVEDRAQCILPFASINGVVLTAAQVEVSLTKTSREAPLAERLDLSFVLRDLCRRRRAATFVLGGSTLHGTIDRVGRDHVDVALHEPGTARRGAAVSEIRLVPLAAIVLVRL